MFPQGQFAGSRVFFTCNDAHDRKFSVPQPITEAKKVGAHGIGFTERAAGCTDFVTVIEHAIPIKQKSFCVYQLLPDNRRFLLKGASQFLEYVLNILHESDILDVQHAHGLAAIGYQKGIYIVFFEHIGRFIEQ